MEWPTGTHGPGRPSRRLTSLKFTTERAPGPGTAVWGRDNRQRPTCKRLGRVGGNKFVKRELFNKFTTKSTHSKQMWGRRKRSF